ncbi:MAG: NADH-quinone oxidoreductase subunit NuoH [Candidatus Eisenbacteria bacterium]|uniref:NADH-quinone oxidoreductase subunit H n=1 Tax=Eiseniibacteriota bacterium TaxID=2212470 RepID=A0A538SEF3_UNCEI|nr:MAG: NADH-quinone oxidoreductase subunit NuoH [Candidatus Eisenbacteria bacterium]
MDATFLIASAVKVLVVLGFVLLGVPLIVWMERKVIGHMQDRIGPQRVGPFGLLQTIADGIKLFFKEDIVPDGADRVVFIIAPALPVITAFLALAVIPFGDTVRVAGHDIPLQITDVNIAVLWILGTTSMGVYGIVLGGWASNSKYPLLGGLRSSAQMISYELAQGISLVSVIVMTGTLSLASIVRQQEHLWFIVPQFFAFVIYILCGIAETNRAPFDLAEAETELVAGFHTEFSSMKFALYFLAEYANMMVVSGIAISVFFGGWHGPFLPPVVWFLIKLSLFLFFYVWLRATFPRLRYDQLMAFGWKVLLPASLLNLTVTALVVGLTA